MFKVFLLSVVLAVVIAHDGKSEIVGGRKVINSSEFPFMVQINLKQYGTKNLYLCGASIIAPDILLTAAHCIDEISPEDLIIFAGKVRKLSPSTQKRYVQKVVIHENFTIEDDQFLNDIGMIFLTKPFQITKFVSPIEGPGAYDYEIGSKVTTTGWGDIENGNIPQWLQKTDLYLISNTECQTFHKISQQLTDDVVCAINLAKTAICSGDSGGPLIYKDKLIGVSSFSFYTPDNLTGKMICNTYFPSGFVRLSYYIEWIDKIWQENAYIDRKKFN